MRIRLLGIIALLFIFPPLGAETYMIFREIYSVTGRTKSSSLTGRFGNPVGQRFASREAVETFASDRRQRLENMRFFQSVEISTDYGDALGDGTIPVMLEVHIVDGVAVFPLPMLFYNSNQGLTMGMYAMMPNFMGTLRSAGMGGSYQAYPDEQGKLAWADPNFFFMLMLQGIRLNEKMELSLFFMAGRPLVPVRVDEAIVYEYQTQTAVFKPGVTYRLSENLTNQMGMGLAGTYQPERTQENAPEYARYGPAKGTVSFSDTLEYRDVNWTGNFRDGFRTALTADYSLVFPHFAENYRQLQIKGEAAAYRVISPRLNPQVRFRLLYATGYPQLDLGR
ncbi:MAG: hypothetical protein LBS64_01445, partial [Spirochaetaceae bacterium]|nr:hypothetical protein [Spirochaetaceae bacterium]